MAAVGIVGSIPTHPPHTTTTLELTKVFGLQYICTLQYYDLVNFKFSLFYYELILVASSHFVLLYYCDTVIHNDICSGEGVEGKVHSPLSTYKSISSSHYFCISSSHYFCISLHHFCISSHYFCILSFEKRSYATQLYHSQDTQIYSLKKSHFGFKTLNAQMQEGKRSCLGNFPLHPY